MPSRVADLVLKPARTRLLLAHQFKFLCQSALLICLFGVFQIALKLFLPRLQFAQNLLDMIWFDLPGFALFKAFEILVELLDRVFKSHFNPLCMAIPKVAKNANQLRMCHRSSCTSAFGFQPGAGHDIGQFLVLQRKNALDLCHRIFGFDVIRPRGGKKVTHCRICIA